MNNDLLERLRDLRALLEKATPGEWYVETETSDGEYGDGPNTRSGYDAFLICAEGAGTWTKNRVLFDSHNSTETEVEEDQHCDEYGDIDAWDRTAKANAALIVAMRNALPDLLSAFEQQADREASLFDAIQHGDEDHQAWLKDAISAHFEGQPVPEPRGGGRKEAIIEQQEREIEAMREALERLGSMEAFEVSRAIDPRHDAELLARIDFARTALKKGRPNV